MGADASQNLPAVRCTAIALPVARSGTTSPTCAMSSRSTSKTSNAGWRCLQSNSISPTQARFPLTVPSRATNSECLLRADRLAPAVGLDMKAYLRRSHQQKNASPSMAGVPFVSSVSPLPGSPNHQRLTPAGRAVRSTGGPLRSRAFARVPCYPLSCALNAPVTWRLLRPAQACRACCARFPRSTVLGPRSCNTPRRTPTNAA